MCYELLQQFHALLFYALNLLQFNKNLDIKFYALYYYNSFMFYIITIVLCFKLLQQFYVLNYYNSFMF